MYVSTRLRFLTAFLLVLSFALAGCQTTPKGLTAAQIAVLKQQGFTPTDEGWELGLSDKLLFGSDVANLNTQSRESVAKIGRALVGVGIVSARVDGHTDAVGSDAYNDQLSLRRAQVVAEALVETGMAKDRIEARGMGKRVPIADNKSSAGRSENRRVAVVITN